MDFCFYLITDRKSAAGGRDVVDVLARAIDGGVKGVLLREKDLPERELLTLAGKVRELTARTGVRFLMSERVDVALAVGADGVQLSGRSLPAARVRELLPGEMYLAVSAHTLDEALGAQADGADFVTFSPVYEPLSKPGYGPAAGVPELARVCKKLTIPVFALGGITADNAVEALKAGAYGVAVISAVFAAPDPAFAAGEIIERMRDFKLKRVI